MHQRKKHSIIFLLMLLFFYFSPFQKVHAQTDEVDQFMYAKNAFDTGDYQVAVQRFNELIQTGINNPALILETHKLMGVSYLFIGDEEKKKRNNSLVK